MPTPLAGLRRDNVLRELLAGVTLLALAVPLNIGYAQIAGLPPTAGLYAMIVPSILFAIIASTPQVVASPDAAAAALVFSSLTGLGVAGDDFVTMAAAQAIVSGLMFVAASFLRLGFLADFLSEPILLGFVGGLALDILISQIAKMLGVSIDFGGEFAEKTFELVTGLDEANWWAAGLAAGAVVVLLAGRRLLPIVPWALVALVLATVVTAWWSLQDRGVAVLGAVDSGPPTFSVPRLDPAVWLSVVPSALALTLVTIAEGLLVARSYAERNGYRTDPNRDLLAFGALTPPRACRGPSRSDRRPRGPPRWTRPAREPSCRAWSPPSALWSC